MDSITGAKKLIKEMNRYYEARALWHDSYMSYESNEAMEELLRPIIDILEEMIVGKTVLEIACGTGNWTQVLAKRADSVVAIDISPTALRIAQNKLAGYDNVLIMQSDAYDLANVGGFYEVLFAADWWSHIPKAIIPSFLDTIMARLCLQSAVLFLDMLSNKYFEQEACFYDDDNNRIGIRKLPDGSEYRVIKNFPAEQELRAILAHRGRKISYKKFDSLMRWMVTMEPL